MRTFRPALLAAFVLGLMLPATSAMAITIEVVVNGQPITSYDIQQRVALLQISGQSASTSAATNQLIDEAIQLTEAAARGVVVPASAIESAYNSIASQVQLSPSQFGTALLQSGVDPDALRQRLRAQLAWQQLLQLRVQTVPIVSQQQISAALQAQGNNTTIKEFLLQPIVFVIPANSSAGYVDQRRAEAESFRARFTGCQNSLAQAQALRGVVVLETIRRDSTELAGDRGEEIQGLTAGRTTRPARTSEGIEVIAVCDVVLVQNSEAVRSQIRIDLLNNQADQISEDYMTELRADAIIQRF